MFEQSRIVNEDLQALVEIELVSGATINCLLDTGFHGTLFLPRDFVEANSLPIVAQETFVAAESIRFQVDSALAEIKWLGDEFTIPIFVSETDEALIGVEMLIDALLEIDYKNSNVKITK
jgi:clan AA aspartic protease